jgi:hypothetical protein
MLRSCSRITACRNSVGHLGPCGQAKAGVGRSGKAAAHDAFRGTGRCGRKHHHHDRAAGMSGGGGDACEQGGHVGPPGSPWPRHEPLVPLTPWQQEVRRGGATTGRSSLPEHRRGPETAGYPARRRFAFPHQQPDPSGRPRHEPLPRPGRRAWPPPARHQLVRAMIDRGVPVACSGCGLGPVWRDRPLTLAVDHMSGDWLDNRLENLRFLCPNCHAQTATWCRQKSSPSLFPGGCSPTAEAHGLGP